MGVVSLKGSLLLMAFLIHTVLTAPVIEENTALLGPDQIAEGTGCYYNYEHYEEGDRILTNEPCLNCTCHNRMLMCYLRVCPFTKAIGQDCKVEKKPDQCCPVITCPQVPVALLTSSTTETTASSTAVGHPDNYGCVLDDNVFYADGAQVPSDPRKPCELCYCIRNQTACVMQECTLNVEGCKPVYQEGVCCPVRYDCDYDEVLTTPRPTAGLVTTPGGPNECKANDRIFKDGEMIENMTDNPCEHCYCMRGDVVCAVQECGTPLENTECTPMPAEPGQCCPNTYQCPNGTVPAHVLQASTNLKPSPPVAPSLAQIKPEGATETPVFDDKVSEGTDSTSYGQENNNAEEEQQEPEKTDGPVDSTVAESNEVTTEAPKQQAIIEIVTTSAPQEVAEGQTHQTPSEAAHTDVEQLPGAEHEISSVLEIVPENDQVEEGHEEEEGHVEDGHDDVEATTAPGHYTEISVENVEMNTSAPEVAKPDIPSASHTLDETANPNTEVPQEITTVGPSSPIKEQPMNGNEEVNNQLVGQDASEPSTQDATSELDNQDVVSQAENVEATTKPEENQDAVSQPENQEAVSQPENPIVSQIDNQDVINQPDEAQVENQQPTSQPDVQSEVQETIRPEIQEVINQLDNEGAGSHQDKEETVQPETQEPNSQQVNQESSSQQEIVSSPTEPAPSSQMPQEPLPQENEKLSAVSDLPETTSAPVSSTTTTEAEPEEMPRIPGEGSCLHKGITYAPNTEVPSANTCKRCRCINSIVQCNDIECPEPPVSLYSNCVPMPPTDDACCPTYFCEQKPSQEPEVDSMSIDKIDEGVEEVAPEEGIAPTTVASVHEDVPAVSENFVPGTHEISGLINPNADNGSQPDSQVSEDSEEVKPSGGELLPESVIPSGEESKPESDVPSEGSLPESVIPSGEESKPESDVPSEGSQPESVIPSGEESEPESNVAAEGSQPESVIPSGEESKPESHVPAEASQPESVIPSGEESKPESDVPAEASQPESEIPAGEETKPESDVPAEEPQPESVIPSGEEPKPESDVAAEASQPESEIPSGESKPESDVVAEGSQPESANLSEVSQPESSAESATEPHVANDVTTALPEVPSDHQGITSLDQKEESPVEVNDDVHPVSLDDAESDSDTEATSTSPSQVISEEQGSKLTEAQDISEVPETTAVHDQQPSTEGPQHPNEEGASLDESENAHPEHATVEPVSDIYTSTEKLQHQELQESQGSQDASESEKLEESIRTTVPPVHEESTHEGNEHEPLPQHEEMPNGEAHDGQESVTEDGSSALGVPNTDTPSISMDEHEGAEHDSEPSGSSQPIEAEAVPTIDQAENDLTATHDQSTSDSPTTAIPDETSSIHAEYNEAQLLSTEGPSGASETPEIHEPMVTSGPPVLFPDIGHQGAPIHIPGPTGINTDGITSEDERLGETEAPSQELNQTENPQAPEESSPSGNVQQASEVSEGGVKDDTAYTTEGLSSVPSQTEEVANEIVPGGGSDADSEHNQITESSQTNEPSAAHDDANEISPPEHKPAESGDDQGQVEEVEAPEKVEPTEVSQSATETPDEPHHETEVQPTQDETEIPTIHDKSEVHPVHDDTVTQSTHDESEAGQTHVEPEVQPTHDESEAQPTHDESVAEQIHDDSEAQQSHEETHNEEEAHAEQVETEAPSISEKDVTEEEVSPTEGPLVPIVTHGDLPTPSEPIAENVVPSVSETEVEKQPETTETQQSQEEESSASQPAVESQLHEEVESESEHSQEVTQAPENDEVVTHIDSAGPQQVPEIANQVVETETNAIEHATGSDHEEVPTSIEDEKTGADEVANAGGDHQESNGQEQTSQPEQAPITPEEHHSDSVDENQEDLNVAPVEHHEQPDVVPVEQQEHPESDHVPAIEDHSEGHSGPFLSGAHTLEETEKQQTEQPISEIPSEQTQPAQQQPEIAQPETEAPESLATTGETQSEPSGPQEETVQALPEVTHDENQPEQPAVEEHVDQVEPHHEETHEDHSDPHSEVIEEQPHTTPISEPQGPSQDTEVQPEHQNVVSGQQVAEEEEKPAISEHQESHEVAGDGQETATSQESGSGQPITDGPVAMIEETSENVPLISLENGPAPTGEEHVQTDAPVEEQAGETGDVTAVPEQSGNVAGDHQPLAEEEKDVGLTMETTPAVQHGDLVEGTHEQPDTPEGQPNETIVLSPDVPESEPSGSDSPIQTPEEVPIESAPSAPSAPESAPSAPGSVAQEEPSALEAIVPEQPLVPESVVPDQPSAPESVVPDQPSAPESVVPDQPSAPESVVPDQPSAPESVVPDQPSAPELVVPEQPEYTAPEQPPAPESEVQPLVPEQPAAPETKPSSVGEDEVPIPQESDSSSQPEQSSHTVEEIEKEQPIPETSSSPISELPQSSPLPPVEIPSTEGPVLPPGLQTWSQKPYHPPSLPEHQQHHHTTAEVPHLPEDSHYPSQPYDQDYEDDDNVSYGPGTCRYGGKVYLSAQQIPRDDPCDFCFCFRSDIICLQQSCPPPIRGCYQETIKGFCCPRYECHVSMATMVNITTTSTTTTTTVPPHFLSHHYNGSAMKAGCQVKGIAYRVGDRIPSTSGPCLDCRCGADGQMKCDPTVCGPQESLLRQVMAASVSKRRRR